MIFNQEKNKNVIIHLDTLGLPILLKEVVNFVNLNLNGTLKMNDIVLQSETSDVCGHLNVALVHYLASGRAFETFISDHENLTASSIKARFAPLLKHVALAAPAGQVCKAARKKLTENA